MARAKAVVEWWAALVAVILLAPVMVAVALAVRCSGPGPVVYRRRVLGLRGVPFDAFKFRTMVLGAEAMLERDPELNASYRSQFKLRDDPRVTPIGRFLRRYSLDELPQLVNVLRGEMALVGPRMISPDEVSRYGVDHRRLLSVRPGITGIWQVSGRHALDAGARVTLDLWYVANWSLWLDLKIVLRTLPAVLKADGAL
jgi:lipopolysaccharide/colanic/teichoic acid biosynthesis glycosyltransferase